MRLKSEMEEMRKEARKRQKEALKKGQIDKAMYYDGVMIALAWVQDKKNENTFIHWSDKQ